MRRLAAIILLLGASLWGQFTKEGTTAAQFLKIGVGARALGMGGAYVALADDGSAHFWNPAGLAAAEGIGVMLMHNAWLVNINHDYLSVALPAGNLGVLGLSVTVLTMGEQEITTVEQPDGTGAFYRVQDLAVGLSFARQVTDRLRYGLTAKYIHLQAWNESARTLAVDLGSVMNTGFKGIKIGMALSNFGGNIRYEGRDLLTSTRYLDDLGLDYSPDANLATEDWPLPLGIQIGIAGNIVGSGEAFINNPQHRLTMAIDAVHPNDAPEHLNFGLEYALWEGLFIRAGYRANYDLDEMTFGAGLRLPLPFAKRTHFDYARMPMGLLGQVERFSLDIQF